MAKKDKNTNNDAQDNTQTTSDKSTRSPLKLEVKSGVPEGYPVPVQLVAHVSIF